MQLKRYPSITGLRALSVALVLFHHLDLQNDIFRNLERHRMFSPIMDFLRDGQIGVNVFFVISGFLITSLLMKEETTTGTISVRDFYIRRTLRIFPAYYFLLLVYFVLQLVGFLWIDTPAWITAITYTKYFNWQEEWFTSHAWSLSIEEHFYLFWPLVFLAGKKWRTYVAAGLFCIVPFVRTYLHFYPNDYMNENTLFTRIDAIALGCLCAVYKDRIIAWMSPNWKKLFYASVVLLLSFPYAPLLDLDFIFIPLGMSFGTIANILIAIVMMFSIYGPHGTWYHFLNLKTLNYLGLLSYSLYLWQQLFINRTTHWINQFPQNIILTFLCALFSYYIIEKPFLRIKTRFQDNKTKALKSVPETEAVPEEK